MATPFATIKKLLVPYAKHFSVVEDDVDAYHVAELGYLITGSLEVTLFLWPLGVFKKLKIPAALERARLHRSRTILKFEKVTATQNKALVALIAQAAGLVDARRKRATRSRRKTAAGSRRRSR